jgi:hypothetical protein
MLKQVDLPAPLGPIIASISPRTSPKLTSRTACTPPNALESAVTDNSGGSGASGASASACAVIARSV